jgi:hypothetical protein
MIGDDMTKKTIVCENDDFEIIRIMSMVACCCGRVPFNSICIRKKGAFQQLNLEEEKFKSLRELLNRDFKEAAASP